RQPGRPVASRAIGRRDPARLLAVDASPARRCLLARPPRRARPRRFARAAGAGRRAPGPLDGPGWRRVLPRYDPVDRPEHFGPPIPRAGAARPVAALSLEEGASECSTRCVCPKWLGVAGVRTDP